MKREKIDYSDVFDGLSKLSEGNPGAASVLAKMLTADDFISGSMALAYLDEMNIRGYQIWVAYKDYCGENIDLLIKSIIGNDERMLKCINIETARCAIYGEVEEAYKAVPCKKRQTQEYQLLTPEEIDELKDQPKPRHPSTAAGH